MKLKHKCKVCSERAKGFSYWAEEHLKFAKRYDEIAIDYSVAAGEYPTRAKKDLKIAKKCFIESQKYLKLAISNSKDAERYSNECQCRKEERNDEKKN